MDPLEVLESTGRRRDWVAGQMGISESYLSLLLNGKRRWTEDVRKRFALATGVPVALIVFCAVDCDTESDEVCGAVIDSDPAEAPSAAQDEREGALEYQNTRGGAQ
jgi:transcriptional regulator with XRE-family HTH domain